MKAPTEAETLVLLQSGWSRKAIGERFGISGTRVSQIVARSELRHRVTPFFEGEDEDLIRELVPEAHADEFMRLGYNHWLEVVAGFAAGHVVVGQWSRAKSVDHLIRHVLRQCAELPETKQPNTRARFALWCALRGGQVDGLLFHRHHRIDRYCADFACESISLLIEVDDTGGEHEDNKPPDPARQHELQKLGWFTLRFSSKQVTDAPDAVIEAIRDQARKTKEPFDLHPPAQLC